MVTMRPISITHFPLIYFSFFQESPYLGNACANSPDPTAAIAAVAHGLRQQMCNMVAAAHHHGDTGLVNSLNLLSHCNSLGLPTNGMRLNSPLDSAHDLRVNSPGLFFFELFFLKLPNIFFYNFFEYFFQAREK